MPGLMHLQRIEETFHDNHLVAARLHRAIEIKQYLRLPETGGEKVLWVFPIDRRSRICNQPALLVPDWGHATARQPAHASIHPHSKALRRGRRGATLREV